MALYCEIEEGNKASCLEFNVGDKQAIDAMKKEASFVVSLQADGHELEAIRDQFTGIPMHNGRVVEWFGDHAKFIARHFK